MTYWWLVATLIWVVLLIGRSNFFYQLSQKHMPLLIINDCFVSRIPCSFLFPLVPLFPCSPCSPCSPLFPLVPLVPPCSPFPTLFPLFLPCSPCPPLFPFSNLVTPCSPLFPLFPLVPLVPPCSPCSPLFPLVPLVPLCSPVPLFHLQFTTLNFWQSQISVNKKKKRSHFTRNPLKSRIPSHKHVTKKVLHPIWWRQLDRKFEKSGQNYEKTKRIFRLNYSDFIRVVKWQVA